MSINIGEILLTLWNDSGFAAIISNFGAGGWQNLAMLAISCVLLYLAIVKQFEPLLLCGIAFGCLLSNLPAAACTIRSCGMPSWIPAMLPTIPMVPS